MSDRVLTVEEAAEILKLHPVTVRALLGRGELPGRKIGGSWRILESDLLAFVHGEGKPGGDGPAQEES